MAAHWLPARDVHLTPQPAAQQSHLSQGHAPRPLPAPRGPGPCGIVDASSGGLAWTPQRPGSRLSDLICEGWVQAGIFLSCFILGKLVSGQVSCLRGFEERCWAGACVKGSLGTVPHGEGTLHSRECGRLPSWGPGVLGKHLQGPSDAARVPVGTSSLGRPRGSVQTRASGALSGLSPTSCGFPSAHSPLRHPP